MDNSLIVSEAFPPWLTATKTLPLKHNISLIERSELTRRLNSGLEQKLSLLVAPAGFGKSTLLGQWRQQLLEKNISVAWLNIDEDDNDPSLLALYLSYSLATAGLMTDILDLHPTGFSQDTSYQMILGILSSAIARRGTKTVLVLDDVEKLEKLAIGKILDPLLHYSPDNLHLVLASRTADRLQLSALKLRGQVNRIITPELKFTPFEIDEFFGRKLDKKSLLKITGKTEGWPVALQLIKNSLAGHGDHKRIIDKFRGTEQDTRRYIYEQILNSLTAPQKGLLLDVSILSQFDPNTVDRIRETGNSHIILKEMESMNRLITPLEDRDDLYRLHPLFREALSYYLEKWHPERVKILHLKAADMFLEQGDIIASIRHALRAGAPETAAGILEKAGGILLWNREGMARIRRAHALLPEQVINTHPRLSLLRALILLKDGHLNDARHIYDRISLELDNNVYPRSAELDYDLAVITASLAIYEGTPLNEEMSDRLISSIERFEKMDRLQVGFVHTILCVFNLQKGNFPAAREIGYKAISFFRKHRSLFGETYIYVHLGVIATSEGKLDEACEYFKKVQDNQRRYFSDDKDLRLIINILMAEWHYERNELASAARLLKDITHRLESGEAWYEIYAAGYSISTALAYIRKGLGACLNLSDDATSYIRREGLRRLNRLVIANEVGYLCRAGKIADARNLVQENNLNFPDYKRSSGIYFSVRECYGVIQALGRLLIAEGRYGEAIRELRAQVADHGSSHEIRAIQKYRLLLSIALFEDGQKTPAFKELDEVLTFVRSNGFLRFVMDEEPFVIPLLEACIDNVSSSEKDHARYLLGQINDVNPPRNSIILSRRETQVLHQLAEGFSDKVIARNLEISENTIRFHLKNLFGKLNVNSRLMAVSEAKKHKILQ